uniref:Chemokine interleukin-8-like domain-containing protein n=1 Tax=Nannospalax galili TaxID=1026970 RepID=A0A8C6RBD6_NANGA
SLTSPTSQGLSLETPRLLLTSWHPQNRTKPKQEALPLSASTSCCTQLYRQPLPNKLLRKIIYVEVQKADAECHLQAFVLHLARRSVCIHPKNRSLARWLDRQGKKLQGTLPNLNPILQRKTDSPQRQK